MRVSFVLVLTCLVCLPMSACEEDLSCEEICARENGCPGATQRDCPTWCLGMAEQALTTRCTEEWKAHLGCKSRHRELICDTALPCKVAISEHYKCVVTFCVEDPSLPVCPSL